MEHQKERKMSLLKRNQHCTHDQVIQVLHSNIILLRHITFVENQAIFLEIILKQREY